MPPQVSKTDFAAALSELGVDPALYSGKRLTLQGLSDLYEISQDLVLEAIERRHIAAHYDYHSDTIWVDALDAAHFYYCIRTEAHLYSES
jgi:hypothetical protein